MTLPTFGVRELNGPSDHGLINITSTQYDATISSYPNSVLTYVDHDDGQTITVGSGLELLERLEEPLQPARLSRPSRWLPAATLLESDQKVHIFDTNRAQDNLTIWRDHAAYSGKPQEPFSPLTLSAVQLPAPVSQQLNCARTQPTAVNIIKDKPVAAERSSIHVLQTMDEVLQTACKGLEAHLGGFASFLDLTAAILQAAAQKTRETDTTPIETILSGLKEVLVEVGQVGMELLREFDPQGKASTTQLPEPPVEQTSVQTEPKSEVTSGKETGFASEQPAVPIFATTFKRPNPPVFGSGPAIENAVRVPMSTFASPVACYRSFPNRPAPPPQAVPATSKANLQDKSLMDDDFGHAEFAARYPPLTSLKRARTIATLRQESFAGESSNKPITTKSALTRYPSIGQLESNRGTRETAPIWRRDRNWRHLHGDQIASGQLQDSHKDRSLRGYRKPTVEESVDDVTPKATSSNTTKDLKDATASPHKTINPLPGSWPSKYGPADVIFYESSDEYMRRTEETTPPKPTSPTLSCRMTSPPVEQFTAPKAGLRRAQTVTASNPAARLNGPFDPLDGVPHARLHATGRVTQPPQRSITQHISTQRSNQMFPNLSRPHTGRNAYPPLHIPAHRPSMPGAFPYPPVLQPQPPLSIRHMRSEPNFAAPHENLDVKVNKCVKTLENMGYGAGNRNEASRLSIYAGAASGDVVEAIEMIEEERRAAKDMMR